MLSKSSLIKIFINTSFGVVLILIWLKLVDINQIARELSQINFLNTLPFFLFFLISGFLRALRLNILLKKYESNVSLKNITYLTFLGQLLSFTVPLRIGEVAKGVYLSTTYKLDTAKSVVWIFMDRFIDFWAVLALALMFLLLIPTNLPSNFVFILIVLIGILTLIVSLVIFFPKLVKGIISFFSKFLVLPILQKYFSKITNFLVDSASFLNQGGKTSLAIIITFLALLTDAMGYYALFLVVFKGVNFLPIFLGSLLSMLTYLVPAAPGYVGSAEASGLAVFSYGLGFDKNLTSVVIVLYHALTLISMLMFGVSSLYLLKFDLNLVWKKFRKNG